MGVLVSMSVRYYKDALPVGAVLGGFSLLAINTNYKLVWGCNKCGAVVSKHVKVMEQYQCIECAPYKNLTGAMVGGVTVKSLHTKTYRGRSWRCICSLCCKEKVFPESLLLNTPPLSCGCNNKPPFKTGDKVNQLTVIKRSSVKNKWECKCVCGTVVHRQLNKSDRIKNPISCGCHKWHEYEKVLAGKQIGKLFVIKLKLNSDHRKVWMCGCYCGNHIARTTESIYKSEKNGTGCNGENCAVKDLTGSKIGKLEVLSIIPNMDGPPSWRCMCSCGNVLIRLHKHLKRSIERGSNSNCGCMTHTCSIGAQFGKLTVTGKIENRTSGSKSVVWEFTCSCGTHVHTTYANIRKNEIDTCPKCAYEKEFVGKIKIGLHILSIQCGSNKSTTTALCECLFCGSLIYVPILRLGKQKSCGCYNKLVCNEAASIYRLSCKTKTYEEVRKEIADKLDKQIKLSNIGGITLKRSKKLIEDAKQITSIL